MRDAGGLVVAGVPVAQPFGLEPVSASFDVATACLYSVREPGVARRATHFLLLRQKKVSKEKATLSLRPLRGAKGQTCAVAVAGCAVELTARRWRFVRTTTASQFTKQPRTCATATPQPPRRRRSQKGLGRRTAKQLDSQTAKQPDGSSLRSTRHRPRPPLAAAPSARRLNPRDGAERSKGPNGCPLPIPSVCAEERRVWRIRARDCLSEASSSETPTNPSTAGCPEAKRRGRRQWGRPFFGDFLSATRKKVTRMPGDSRPPPSALARGSHRQTRLRQAQSEWAG